MFRVCAGFFLIPSGEKRPTFTRHLSDGVGDRWDGVGDRVGIGWGIEWGWVGG